MIELCTSCHPDRMNDEDEVEARIHASLVPVRSNDREPSKQASKEMFRITPSHKSHPQLTTNHLYQASQLREVSSQPVEPGCD